MKKQLLDQIIKKKENKNEFAIITNIANGESCIFEKNKPLDKSFEKYSDQVNNFFNKKKNGIIENTDIFVETYVRPIKVIIVGAVHIAQYLVDYAKSLNFEISIIDPRGYFASEQRFPDLKIINKWPEEAFKEIETNENSALIALTHDPKIDDPALQHALKNKFYYIGALGSKKTHENRCKRLKEAGFSEKEINLIHGPIGIKLGGKSAPEIALSIIAQLVSETHNNK
jgi:xanthine dehydrogenase accessory factor